MQLNKLPIETAAILGSTHEVVIDYSDLSDTAGTTKTLTVTIPAGSWVRGGAHVLETDFTDGAATMSSLVYTVGDGGDADLYMTSTEVETTGTEIDYKAPTQGLGLLLGKPARSTQVQTRWTSPSQRPEPTCPH